MQSVSPQLDVGVVTVTHFFQNCSLLRCAETHKGAVVDPGGDVDHIVFAIEQAEVEVEKILLTHGHVDHVAGAGELARRLEVPIEGPHREDLFLFEVLAQKSAEYGLEVPEPFMPNRWLEHGDEVTVGELAFEVLLCPGHTPGHVVFFHRPSKFVVVGDVIFRGSIGRTDFPRSEYDALIRSIRETLLPLGDDVTFLPGHGPTSTLGEERRSNPFVTDPDRYRFM